MVLTDHYDGSGDAFEGDLTLQWRSLPAGALVSKARLKITPVKAADGTLFQEVIRYSNGQGDFGATKNPGNNFVEVDFHKRRTLASLTGANLTNANLQVDMGGVYVEVNTKGAIKANGDSPFSMPADGTLPSLTVSKFKLTAPATGSTGTPDVSSVTIRSVPNNLTVRLGNLPPVWTRLGEMTAVESSPDFTQTLQVLLRNATVKDGYFQIPVILRSDSICRLDVDLVVEYVIQANLQPQGLQEVVLPFDYSTVAKAYSGVLSVALPRNAVVVPQGTAARLKGTFDSTRIVYGPSGQVAAADSARVSPAESQAQSLALNSALAATGVDLWLTGVTRTAGLRLDLRGDLDGKPDVASLLSGPVEFSLDAAVAQQASWVSVALPTEFHFQGGTQRYWIILQSLDGTVDWGLQPAPSGAVALQHTQDGGLSWHDTPSTKVPGALAAFFRLRDTPDRFQVPVDLQIGTGADAVRVKLDRYQPLGRVDFSLDSADVSNAFNEFTTKALGAAPPDGEQLANGNFDQWNVVGNDPGTPGSIRMSANPLAVVFSPDGKWAYIAGADSSNDRVPVLTLVDVTCDQAKANIQLVNLQNKTPQAIAVHPDGSRLYIMGPQNLDVFDVTNWRELGALSMSALPGGSSYGSGLVASRDGSRLYITTTGNAIFSLDTAKLEQAVTDQLAFSPGDVLPYSPGAPPAGIAVSPDGSRLYATVPDGSSSNFISVFDTASGGQPLYSIVVGSNPGPIILTPDGSLAIVGNMNDNTLSFVDTTSRQISSVPVGGSPAALAISPDGQRVFVATAQPQQTTGTANGVTVIDLARRAISGMPISLATAPGAVAISPQGDRLYVASTGDGDALTYIPFGVRVPAEWSLTSGQVLLKCLRNAPPSGVVVAFAHRATPASRHNLSSTRRGALPLTGLTGGTSSEGIQSNETATALSQVIPVSVSINYAFSVWGGASDTGAVAEVFWLGQTCAATRTDRIPIQVVDLAKRDVRFAIHRAQYTAPAGANQAEIRFSSPGGVLAGIAKASMRASPDALANGDFQARDQQGGLASWTQAAQASSQIMVSDVTLIKNPGRDAVELVQSVAVNPGKAFVLRFTGQALALTSTQDHPSVEVHWLTQDGSETGASVSLAVLTGDFDQHAASGTTPPLAAQAAVHLVLPGGTGLAAQQVALESQDLPSLPLGFVAQAPGELRVSQATVAYDVRPAVAAPVPARGLCTPTPPGANPGEASSDSCFCPCCQENQPMVDPAPAVTNAGRPVLVGECANCGSKIVSAGGALVPAAPTISLTHLPVVSAAPSAVKTPAVAPVVPALTVIPGIGAGRVRQLAVGGIKSIQDLAKASPQKVARTVKGLSLENALAYVDRANAVLASLEQPPSLAARLFTPPAKVSAATSAAAAPRPLTAVAGIGPDRARKLARAGISSVENLALASPHDVARALRKSGVSSSNAATLVAKARILVGARKST